MAAKNPIASLQALARALPGMAERAMAVTMREAAAQGQRTTAFQNQTGRLRASIRAGITEKTVHHVVGSLTAGAHDASPGRAGWETASWEYGPHVELGTSRMSPRSYIWTTMHHIAAQNILGRAMQAELRKWHP